MHPEAGDRLPTFDFTDLAGRPTSVESLTLTSQPFLLHVTRAGADLELRALAGELRAILDTGLLLVLVAAADRAALRTLLAGAAPFAVLPDRDGTLADLLGVTEAAGLVIGPDLRVRARLEPGPGASIAARLRDAGRCATERVTELCVTQLAPVLILPAVLGLGLRARLIEAWHGAEPIRDRVGTPDGTVEDRNVKRRADVFVAPPLLDELHEVLGRRLLPEVARVFHFEITRAEPLRIGVYEGSELGGFRPHRDNTVSTCAHRRFAMSLLLDDGYEGGHLAFPEFPGTVYRPPAGAALVFSCSLLHEVRPVTSGRRFGVFGFFW